MEYTQLGQTDLQVSRICLGTMTWGFQNTQEDGFEQMDYALSQGVNFWDTAEMYAIPPTPETYGKTETIIGNWFQKTGKRKDIILATKFSPLPWARGEETPVINRANIITAVDNSLKRLQTDYIDLYQFHWPTNRSHYHFGNYFTFKPAIGTEAKERIQANILETLEAMDHVIKQGKVRYMGLSDDSSWGIQQFINLSEKHNLPRIASIQNEYSLICRRDDQDIAETCALENVSYLPWSPLAMGVLSGKYQDKMPKGARMSPDLMAGDPERYSYRLSKQVKEATALYLDIAKKHNLDPCQMAIAFTIHEAWQTSTIIGASNLKQLETNIDAINVKLSDACIEDIRKAHQKYPAPF